MHGRNQLIGPIAVNGRAGYLNPHGQWVIEPQYEKLGTFQEGLAAFVQNGKVGFLDEAGRVVIPPKFDNTRAALPSFREKLAPILFEGKGGYADPSGELAFPPRANSFGWHFVGGMAVFLTGGRHSVIDRTGREISFLDVFEVPYFFDFPSDWNSIGGWFAESRAGCLNWKGEVTFPPIYSSLGAFHRGIAPFAPDVQIGPWGLVRFNREIVVPPVFLNIYDFAEDLAPAAKEKRRFGFINSDGEWVISPQFLTAQHFKQGLALVSVPGQGRQRRHGTKGFINSAGEWVVPPMFDRASEFHEGLACVTVLNAAGEIQAGYINSLAAWVIEPRFHEGESFHQGYARVSTGGHQAVIDRGGNPIWEGPL